MEVENLELEEPQKDPKPESDPLIACSAATPLCPERGLPESAFLPGTGMPRPQEIEYLGAPWTAESWSEIEPWLYGVDLYNNEFFWEAHEAWEAVWKSWDKESSEALLIRGCIQSAAALLKLRLKSEGGARKLSKRALKTLERALELSPDEQLLGLNLAKWLTELREFWAPIEREELPEISAYPRIALANPTQ